MDIATLIGLLAGILVIIGAILVESSILDFMNIPGLLIVVIGTLAVSLMKYRLSTVASSFSLAFSSVFVDRTRDPKELIYQVSSLSNVVRKEGILGLEKVDIDDAFLQKGVALCIDGHPPEFIEEVLIQDLSQSMERYETAERIFRGVAETAPGLGMLGTLVGLVQMLNNMSDPSSVGPAMAVALLTTFYGAFIAQVIALPFAEKLHLKATDEHRNMSLVITSIQNILKGQNPKVITEVLSSYLSHKQRQAEAAER